LCPLVENRDEWGSLFAGNPIKIKNQDGIGQRPSKNSWTTCRIPVWLFDYIVKAGQRARPKTKE